MGQNGWGAQPMADPCLLLLLLLQFNLYQEGD